MLIGIDASRAVTDQRTGTEAYALFLIRALILKTARSKHRLRLYFNQPPVPDLFPDLPHVDYQIMPFARLWTQIRLARELRQRPPDVLFTPAHVIPFTYRGPSVATVHDLGYHYFPMAHTTSQVAYLKLSTRANGNLSEQVIADSNTTKADLIRFYGLEEEKINVIYPGMDPELKRVADAEQIAQTAAKYQIDGPYLLYIGTLQPRKNLQRLVHSFGRSGLPHHLVLGGKQGWHVAALEQEIAALDAKVREQVILTGYVAEEDKAALLSGAEALVFPSLYEGFGFPVLEAQVCGTPVLAARSSSLPEITDGSALLIDPLSDDELTDGLRRITKDKDLRQALIAKGFANVRRFDWDKTADEVLRVLEKATLG